MSAFVAIAGSALAIACMLALRLHVAERLSRQRLRSGPHDCTHRGCGGGCQNHFDRSAAESALKNHERE